MRKEKIQEKIQAINHMFTDELLELLKQYFSVNDTNIFIDDIKNNQSLRETIKKIILRPTTK